MHHIIERAWYGTGQYAQRTINPGDFASEMLASREIGETSHRWTGEDRNGTRLHVVWIPNPVKGVATLIAYELSLEPSTQARLRRELLELDAQYEQIIGHNAFLFAEHGDDNGPGDFHFTGGRVLVGVRNALAHMKTLMHDLAEELSKESA